jgi:hypothetical protein
MIAPPLCDGGKNDQSALTSEGGSLSEVFRTIMDGSWIKREGPWPGETNQQVSQSSPGELALLVMGYSIRFYSADVHRR